MVCSINLLDSYSSSTEPTTQLTKIVSCRPYAWLCRCYHWGGPTHWWTPAGQILGGVLTPVTPAALMPMVPCSWYCKGSDPKLWTTCCWHHERMMMQTTVDGARLLQQHAEWHLVIPRLATMTACMLYVQEHGANASHSARAWRHHICTNQM